MNRTAEAGGSSAAASRLADPERRSFLRGRFGEIERTAAIRPPWSTEASIAEACSGCAACAESCPERIIAMDHHGRPRVAFSDRPCSFCAACVAACPEPVFAEPAAEAWRLTLSISDNCLVRSGIYCRSCGDVCAEQAILFRPRLGGKADISFSQADCSGCGACISACPVGATALSPELPEAEAADV